MILGLMEHVEWLEMFGTWKEISMGEFLDMYNSTMMYVVSEKKCKCIGMLTGK